MLSVLYLFAGKPRRGDLRTWLQAEARGCSFAITEVDILRQPSQNVLDADFWESLVQRIRNREFDLFFCSPPCNTWSRAAFANTTGPAPLRNSEFPEGLPWLEGYLKVKAEAGTQLVRKTLELVELCSSLGMPWLVEHPEFLGKSPRGTPASIWMWQESRDKFESCHAATVCFHQCSYGAPYSKPTRLAGTWPNLNRLGYEASPLLGDIADLCREAVGMSILA